MTIKMNVEGIIGIVVGLIGAGFAIGSTYKMKKMAAKLNRTVDQVINTSEIELSETLVNKAVEKAADKAAYKAVNKVASDVAIVMKSDIKKQVSDEIERSYMDISNSVERQIVVEVSKIDKSRLSKEIREEAKKEIITKFNDNLDDILEKYNTDLNNISKVYQSIASSITANNTPVTARTVLL